MIVFVVKPSRNCFGANFKGKSAYTQQEEALFHFFSQIFHYFNITLRNQPQGNPQSNGRVVLDNALHENNNFADRSVAALLLCQAKLKKALNLP